MDNEELAEEIVDDVLAYLGGRHGLRDILAGMSNIAYDDMENYLVGIVRKKLDAQRQS